MVKIRHCLSCILTRKSRKLLPVIISVFVVITFTVLFFTFQNFSKFSSEEVDLECPLCNFKPLNNVSSTKRDVILASALTQFKKVEYFLRTLRTTGSKARVILFIDNREIISDEWLMLFTHCSIEPVFIEQTNDVVKSAPKLSRYYFEHEWLKDHINEVDRVLHTDTFDVIFQSDPFIDAIKADKLYFTMEPVNLRRSMWTDSWVRQCYGNEFSEKYRNEPVSCSGVTIGGAKVFLSYLETLLGTPKWKTCFGHSLDQAHHNALMYTGEFASKGINISGYGCDSPFLTMHFCCKKYHCFVDDDGIVHGNSTDTIPVLVHQYNRWKNLTNRNPTICPKYKLPKIKAKEISNLPPVITEFPKITLKPPV